ncbi:MAG: MinD/ParA family protein, partial [Tissierellia bacterium]|nr:MinD/ParA family protein [Tissierellia bacterium]
MYDRRLKIITGHYGSGKTEFSVNYAIKLKEKFDKVIIADMDIVNPYFRSREKGKMLEKLGIRVVGSNIKNSSVDLPALTPEISGAILNENAVTVLDVGGDPVGA